MAIQALYEVAGTLLERLPVAQTYDDDEETGESAYSRWLQRHTPTRADRRWLADRRDAPPSHALVLPEPSAASTRGRAYDSAWVFEIAADSFERELFPEPNRITVSAYRTIQDYGKDQTVHISSALVAPHIAPSLLRALQTAPDNRAFRIPDATDRDYSFSVSGFELTGCLEPHGVSEGLDAVDPYAGGAHFPPQRPSLMIPALADLKADPDMRLWYDLDGRISFASRVWDESDRGTRSQGRSGYELLADRATLGHRLTLMGRWLIIEVEIRRHTDSDDSHGYGMSRTDDRLEYLQPYSKYFLIDFAGEPHGLWVGSGPSARTVNG